MFMACCSGGCLQSCALSTRGLCQQRLSFRCLGGFVGTALSVVLCPWCSPFSHTVCTSWGKVICKAHRRCIQLSGTGTLSLCDQRACLHLSGEMFDVVSVCTKTSSSSRQVHWKLSEHGALIKLQAFLVRERLSENMGILPLGVHSACLELLFFPVHVVPVSASHS